jgi:hypothetical protein
MSYRGSSINDRIFTDAGTSQAMIFEGINRLTFFTPAAISRRRISNT